MMNPEKRRAFFEQLKANNPKPTTELEYSSPFELLIAVLLSAQATDVSVNKGTKKLFKIANTPQALLDLGEKGVRPYIFNTLVYLIPKVNIFKRPADCSWKNMVAKYLKHARNLKRYLGLAEKQPTSFSIPPLANRRLQ